MPVLWILSSLLHGYVALRLLPWLVAWPIAAVSLGGLLALSTVLLPLGLRTLRRRRGGRDAALHWAGMVSLGALSSLVVLTLLRDAGLLLAHAVDAVWPAALGLDAIALGSAVAVPLLGATATAWGYANARRTARPVEVDLPVAGLPPALEGFTIVQLSDVHVGATIGHAYVSAIVDAVNRLEPDLVAITGDLVDGGVPELAPHVAPLAGLRSRHGTFFVTGNHEYYSGAPAWIAALRGLGMRVLLNEHVVLRAGDASLVLAGVTDWSAGHFDPAQRSDPVAALAGAPADAGARVLLAHQPRSAPGAAAAGFDVQLSGHTHGGQFLPWTWFVRLQQPYTAGLHRLGRLVVYVSRGTGYWGPPKRFGAPSEITRLRLIAAPRMG
ncbi:MAG: metallophosphoesterase [Burkholderiales bacterium]|nr:MAG: metallophosphoesterase [Burkholderiales bacterium]